MPFVGGAADGIGCGRGSLRWECYCGGPDERGAGAEDVRAAKREGVLPPFRDVPSDLGGGAGYKRHTYVCGGPVSISDLPAKRDRARKSFPKRMRPP